MASLSDSLVRHLLESRYIASLATKNPDGSTHMVAVWYWFDGAHIYIATSTRTRKARNLRSTPKISLMIDSRDPAASCGINIVGTAQILTGELSRKWNGWSRLGSSLRATRCNGFPTSAEPENPKEKP